MQKFEAGASIDGFELVERLQSGAMATLWRARNPNFDFPLLLKMPFLDPGGDVSVILGFEAEELILKRLSGPHVPRFAASGSLAKVPYIAMEFVAGIGLAELTNRAPQPPDEVTRIGAEIAKALAALHRQKVVHLDLKPENIILAERGAVLLDFGLARHAELPDLLGEESSVPMGTAAYMSPEQVLGERSDPASDIFALGCILYQLATGEEPFGRPATFAGMKRRLYHAPKPPRDIDKAIPRWLEAVIVRCMAPLGWVAVHVPGAAAIGIRGIGTAPAFVALFLYSLLPVVANTVVGLAGVPRAANDAARGMGMTDRQRLFDVEFPLAFPVILTGIRIVLVQNIGLATIAALIGGGGFGVFVFQGVGQTAMDLVLLGALPTVALAFAAAIILDAVIEMTATKRRVVETA